ncbi:MAG: hypothetical protein M1834_000458 [Cirrosporium novae-zelandiae]|nr:MAG: hypothetical protein M1834_000458 [Cirrosporium novae-zelandiae]
MDDNGRSSKPSDRRDFKGLRDDPRYKDDRRHRSRDRRDHRRERSRSRDHRARDDDRDRVRDRDKDRDRRRGDGRDLRVRSRSRDKHRSRRDEIAPRTGKYHDRSRSPVQDRSLPPRGPRVDRHRERAISKDSKDFRAPRPLLQSKPSSTPNDTDADSRMDVDGGVDANDEEVAMRKMMGFTAFNTTKNKKVPGNNVYGIRKEKKTQYRQYMNRVGGFNRPLSPTRE